MAIVFRTRKKNVPSKKPKKTKTPDQKLVERIFGKRQEKQNELFDKPARGNE